MVDYTALSGETNGGTDTQPTKPGGGELTKEEREHLRTLKYVAGTEGGGGGTFFSETEGAGNVVKEAKARGVITSDVGYVGAGYFDADTGEDVTVQTVDTASALEPNAPEGRRYTALNKEVVYDEESKVLYARDPETGEELYGVKDTRDVTRADGTTAQTTTTVVVDEDGNVVRPGQGGSTQASRDGTDDGSRPESGGPRGDGTQGGSGGSGGTGPTGGRGGRGGSGGSGATEAAKQNLVAGLVENPWTVAGVAISGIALYAASKD